MATRDFNPRDRYWVVEILRSGLKTLGSSGQMEKAAGLMRRLSSERPLACIRVLEVRSIGGQGVYPARDGLLPPDVTPTHGPAALASGPGAIRLIDVEPIGQQPGFVNRGMTGEGDLELVPRYPRPKRDIDSYRKACRVGLRGLANALGVRPSVIGDIVRGAKSPARDVDWDRLFEAVDALAEV